MLEFGLQRLKANPLLQATAATAFLSYGGLLALVLADVLFVGAACVLALISLASWFFLLWWYPVMEDTERYTRNMPGRRWVGRALESFAITCVVVVHVLMAVIIVYKARSGLS